MHTFCAGPAGFQFHVALPLRNILNLSNTEDQWHDLLWFPDTMRPNWHESIVSRLPKIKANWHGPYQFGTALPSATGCGRGGKA